MWILLACTGPEPSDVPVDPPQGEFPAACDPDAPAVDIGTGDERFEPLEDGDPLTMVHGPQGGWHMLASVRAENFRTVVTITYTIHRVSDEARVSWNRYLVELVGADDCVGEYPGMYGYLDVQALSVEDADTPPELLAGDELRLTLQVEDDDGRVVIEEQRVIAALDPADKG